VKYFALPIYFHASPIESHRCSKQPERSVFRQRLQLLQQFQRMIYMFTLENTEGFSQKTLDKMNAEVKERLKKYDPKSKDYKKKRVEIEEEIFDNYCSDSFSPSMKF